MPYFVSGRVQYPVSEIYSILIFTVASKYKIIFLDHMTIIYIETLLLMNILKFL
jgi:hypothetical protein